MDGTMVIQPAEMQILLAYWQHKDRKRSNRYLRNRAIFRLNTGCGLRCCEMSGLQMGDFCWGAVPNLTIRANATKKHNGKSSSRVIGLDLDRGVTEDLRQWYERRKTHPGGDSLQAPFLCTVVSSGMFKNALYAKLDHRRIRESWRHFLKPLGDARRDQLPTHRGRHTFCTYAQQPEVGLALDEVRQMMGHKNLQTTSLYSHSFRNETKRDLYALK